MYLYLIRHGIAVDLAPVEGNGIFQDSARPLTKIGRKKTQQVAESLQTFGLDFDLIFTSPLVRARQTADILIQHNLSSQLEISPDLAPDGTLESWLCEWSKRSRDRCGSKIALIGHEPNLSEWAELLIFGNILHRIMLKKAGMIGLKFSGTKIAIGTAELYCLIPPKYLIVPDDNH